VTSAFSTIVEPVVDYDGMGARVRSLRRARGLSLDRLAALSGVSRSMISEIERGGRVPTILVLDRVATALGTSIARLTRAASAHQPVLLRRAEQDVLDDPAGWERRILSPVLAGVEFEFMRTTLGPRVDAGVFLAHAVDSREYVAVERGTLELSLDGKRYSLEAGDSMFYPGDCRHGFVNPRRAVCVYYLAMEIAGAHLAGTAIASGAPGTVAMDEVETPRRPRP
jgi:transcriptional regulator with XRE-family HTH domain